ncbi:thioredoxin family protein [Nonomuraea angiospora]|uniref:thioredoxin family protein n=1 Tax=Nonomuraea angiospora TaxID=46172 RepID=UPI0029A805A6|nr:thioredoxin family protein [Nonomuraea angiospora]MDX3106029.1 thioredoxin family protein [Nonomuraea angiospora]
MDLHFYSPSCGPCRRSSPLVKAAIEAGKPIRELDVSTATCRYVAGLFGIRAALAYARFGKTGILRGPDGMKELS